MSANKEHDVAVRLLELAEELLLDHLGVVDEADELPFTQMDDALRHVERHVHDCYLAVGGRVGLVGQQGVVDHP